MAEKAANPNSECDLAFDEWWKSPDADVFDTLTEKTAHAMFRVGWVAGAEWVLDEHRKHRKEVLTPR